MNDTPVVSGEPAEHSFLQPGVIVGGRFVPRGSIGSGGLCTVWEAEDRESGGVVALKLAHQGPRLSEQAILRFRREARRLAELAHPNVVSVLAYGIDRDVGPYLAMELLRGPTLWDAPCDGGTLPLREVLAWLAPIGLALDAVHARGLVHRDVKPQNIVRADDHRGATVKLVDFGLAAHADGRDRVTALGQVVGTPHYIAPEVAEGLPALRQSDVYSLAVVAFELLTGSLPHRGESPMDVLKAKVNEPAPSLSEATGKIFGLRLEAVFAAALSADSSARPPAATALIEGLRSALR